MDLLFQSEEKAFRAEVRAFLQRELPPSLRADMRRTGFATYSQQRDWQRILNAKGWGAPAWPREFGGTGWSAEQQMAFADECAMASAPTPHIFNITMLGPVIFSFGSEDQRAHWLPLLLNGDVLTCQGFSEPGAGSDLAALSTSCRKTRDGYVINGTKIWTSQAHGSEWIFCLVRTDPDAGKKQAGISFVVVDLKSPGVSIQPIIGLDGRHSLNQVFFDDVHIPADGLIGEENKGWSYAKFLLGHERTYVAGIGRTRERIDLAREVLLQRREDGVSPERLADWQLQLALIELDLHALEVSQLRFKQSHADSNLASLLKVRGSELFQDVAALIVQMRGTDSLRRDLADDSTLYFYSRAVSIFGGSTEVQKNILARSVLGLP